MDILSLNLLIYCIIIEICAGFWFYGYDQVYRSPYSETTNNEIVQTSVITYLASIRNVEFIGIANPYTYKLIMFESVVQYETSSPSNEWNLGVWDSFIYCDENENTLCLYFSDGQYCENGEFRQTAVELTCHLDSNKWTLYDVREDIECIYTAKLYIPQLCAEKGTRTEFLRTTDQIEKIQTASYISDKGNKVNVLPYQVISGSHKVGMSMTVNEKEDFIRITLYGPLNKYFAVGYGSNGMLNTYAIVVNGHHDDEPLFFEQLLDSHAAGYTLSPSFIVEDHQVHSSDNTHQITLSRKLSSSVEIDQYWIFSCVDDYIDIIWSVGRSQTFERHVAFGQDRFEYEMDEYKDYDKSQIVTGGNPGFHLRINWTAIFIMLLIGIVCWYIWKKYKQNIMDFAAKFGISLNRGGGGGDGDNDTNTLTSTNNNSQYGTYGSAQDVQPLMEDKL